MPVGGTVTNNPRRGHSIGGSGTEGEAKFYVIKMREGGNRQDT
jgi:hypothetical protein